MIYLIVLGFGCADVAGHGSNTQQVQLLWIYPHICYKENPALGSPEFFIPTPLVAPDADLLLSLFVLGPDEH